MAYRFGRRRAFTLVETLIAVSLALVIMGAAMLLYFQGNKMFQTTTEHASVREAAYLVLERVAKDLDGLLVSDQLNSRTGNYFMVEPYELFNPVEQTTFDAKTGEKRVESVDTGIRFYAFHHVDGERQETPDGGVELPRIMGQMIEYKAEPIDPANRARGLNLLRNGVRVNQQPLAGVVFRRGNVIYAKHNMASPDAVLDVVVVPKGGMWGTMTEATLQRLQEQGHAVSKTYHLAGYESQFTSLLSLGLSKQDDPASITPCLQAVLDRAAKLEATEGVRKLTENSPMQYQLPPGRVVLQQGVKFDETTTGDKALASAEEREGVPRSTVIGGNNFRAGAGSSGIIKGSL
jgi:hypothetical protein